ncbi:hypothetical protein F4802DRAFT_592377, partial [Xylaria palmicola]
METKTCGKCQMPVSRKNFARHHRRHHESPQVLRCHICSASIRKKGWAKHLRAHKTAPMPSIEPSFPCTPSAQLSSELPQIPGPAISRQGRTQEFQEDTAPMPSIEPPPPCASVAQLSSKLPQAPNTEEFPQSLWHEFLTLTHNSLSPLIAAYNSEIQRAGGLSNLQCKETITWSSIGLRPPLLFPANECWVEKPTPECFLSDLILRSNPKTTVVCRGSPRQPVNNLGISGVFKQLLEPVTARSLCALNMTSTLPQIKVPEWFYGKYCIYENTHEVKTNITPKFSAVDLHVDCGAHGITLLHSGCVKLWALYPLTQTNFDLLTKVYCSNAILIELQGKLEGGTFCIQTEEQAIYLPPGCIHSTITLQGGLTPGITFTTAESLKPSAL